MFGGFIVSASGPRCGEATPAQPPIIAAAAASAAAAAAVVVASTPPWGRIGLIWRAAGDRATHVSDCSLHGAGGHLLVGLVVNAWWMILYRQLSAAIDGRVSCSLRRHRGSNKHWQRWMHRYWLLRTHEISQCRNSACGNNTDNWRCSSFDRQWDRRYGITTLSRLTAAADNGNDVAGCGASKPSSRWELKIIIRLQYSWQQQYLNRHRTHQITALVLF